MKVQINRIMVLIIKYKNAYVSLSYWWRIFYKTKKYFFSIPKYKAKNIKIKY